MVVAIVLIIGCCLIGAGAVMAAESPDGGVGGPVLFAGAILVGAVIWYFPAYEARRRNHPKAEAITVCVWLSLFVWPLWLIAAVWAYTVPATKYPVVAQPEMSPGYLIARQRTQTKEKEVEASRPRSYKVAGVDKESGLDTELVIYAASPANAKAKAELKGVIVTDVSPS